MARHEFSRKTMAEAMRRCGGHCQHCGVRLQTGRIEYDHIVPCELGGDASLSNCQCLCRACHKIKTGERDVPAIRKSDRQRDKASNAFRAKGRRLGNGNHQRRASSPIPSKFPGDIMSRKAQP